jgi:hypothetical protein
MGIKRGAADALARLLVPPASVFVHLDWLHEEQDEHEHGKWEGKQKGKSDKKITESKARQKESTTLCTNLAY